MFSAIKSVLFSISILQSNRAKKGRGSCGRDSGHAHIPHYYTAFPGENMLCLFHLGTSWGLPATPFRYVMSFPFF